MEEVAEGLALLLLPFRPAAQQEAGLAPDESADLAPLPRELRPAGLIRSLLVWRRTWIVSWVFSAEPMLALPVAAAAIPSGPQRCGPAGAQAGPGSTTTLAVLMTAEYYPKPRRTDRS